MMEEDGMTAAVIPDHKVMDDLCVNGFVKDIWKAKEFNNMRYPPHYLIQIMSKYYQNEVLLTFDHDTLFVINTDYILI